MAATTLIVALGLLAAPVEGAVVAAILVLVAVDRALPGVSGFEP